MSTATDLNDSEQVDVTGDDATAGIAATDVHIPTPAVPVVTLDPIENSSGEKELAKSC